MKTSIFKFLNLHYFNNEILTKDNKSLILHSITILILIVLSINAIYLVKATDLVIEDELQTMKEVLIETSSYNDSIDLTFIANLSKANHITAKRGAIRSYSVSNRILKSSSYTLVPMFEIPWSKEWFVSDKLDIVFVLDVRGLDKYYFKRTYDYIYIQRNTPEIIINDLIFNLAISFVFLMSSLFMVIYITSKVRISDLIAKAGNEAMLSSKNNLKFTEAMHHEVKTPLSVLNSSFDKMEVLLEDLFANIHNANYIKSRLEESQDLIRLLEDRVNLNFSIIYNILDKQKNNRAIRFSNGNFNLYALVQHSVEGLKWDTKIKYSYEIDSRLKYLSNAPDGLTNEDFSNIITNHIRNSLEANANMIKIIVKDTDGKTVLYLVDNGNGIPQEVIPMIYLPNFSTKKELKDSDNQGIGMYLCQTLLNEVRGFERVERSSNLGTVFLISLPTVTFKGK